MLTTCHIIVCDLESHNIYSYKMLFWQVTTTLAMFPLMTGLVYFMLSEDPYVKEQWNCK